MIKFLKHKLKRRRFKKYNKQLVEMVDKKHGIIEREREFDLIEKVARSSYTLENGNTYEMVAPVSYWIEEDTVLLIKILKKEGNIDGRLLLFP